MHRHLSWISSLLAAFFLAVFVSPPAMCQPAKNVILITLDGLRPEEVFGGADRRLILSELGFQDVPAGIAEYDAETRRDRRLKLLPFLWGRVENQQGWIAGDALNGSQCVVENGQFFSYPGYNELLCGYPDPQITSNAKVNNKNTTVLEYLNQQRKLQGQVQAFCSWDVFPFIINQRRSGIPVNAGWSPLQVGDTTRISTLNDVAANLFHEWESVRYDVFTLSAAEECMRTDAPKVLYVAFGETDDWAHAGRYDRYLLTARQNDRFIRRLWELSQELEDYRGKTAFLVTTDHGRGDGRVGWKNHGKDLLPGSQHIWMAAFGAGVRPKGSDRDGRYRQSQIAATVAKLLGYDLELSNSRVSPPLPIVE